MEGLPEVHKAADDRAVASANTPPLAAPHIPFTAPMLAVQLESVEAVPTQLQLQGPDPEKLTVEGVPPLQRLEDALRSAAVAKLEPLAVPHFPAVGGTMEHFAGGNAFTQIAVAPEQPLFSLATILAKSAWAAAREEVMLGTKMGFEPAL